MTPFDTFVVVDWSARALPSPARPTKDSIWIAVASRSGVACSYHRTRHVATAWLADLFEAEVTAGRRVVAGFDFPIAWPRGFAQHLTGFDDPLVFWDWLAPMVEDDEGNANNRFDVARAINAKFPGVGPFWGCPAGIDDAVLPAKGSLRHDHGLPEKRGVEQMLPGAQPCWKLYTTGSVGSQALLGVPRLQALRRYFGRNLAVAPFEAPEAQIVLVELFPSLIADTIDAHRGRGEIKDRAQVRVLAQALSRLAPQVLDDLLREGDPVEGWILGAGRAELLRDAL